MVTHLQIDLDKPAATSSPSSNANALAMMLGKENSPTTSSSPGILSVSENEKWKKT